VTDDLETALRTLGTHLDVPETPDLSGMSDAVLARLDEKPSPRWRRVVVAAVAAVVALATAMVVSPAVRAAVYDLLRIGDVEIHENEPAPVSPAPPVEFGEHAVTLAEARRELDFPLRLPKDLGLPATVLLIDGARVVSMAFTTAHGPVRVDEFDGGLDPIFTKFTRADDVHHVTVAGTPAVWVDRPHPVLYNDRDGVLHEESARIAGSTLIFEKDGVTYRVEGELTERQAIEIAESLR